MKRLDLFTTPVWITDECGVDRDKIINFVKVVQAEDPRGREASNMGGWQSYDFIPQVMKHNALSELHDRIMQQAYACADEFGFKDYTLHMLNLWININKKGDSNVTHTHPGSIFSGVYYLSLPDCCYGNFTLQRSPIDQHLRESWGCSENFDRFNENIMDEYDIYPEEDRLVIFPSWIPHRVSASQGDGERISISFNIIAYSNYYHEIYPKGRNNPTHLSL